MACASASESAALARTHTRSVGCMHASWRTSYCCRALTHGSTPLRSPTSLEASRTLPCRRASLANARRSPRNAPLASSSLLLSHARSSARSRDTHVPMCLACGSSSAAVTSCAGQAAPVEALPLFTSACTDCNCSTSGSDACGRLLPSPLHKAKSLSMPSAIVDADSIPEPLADEMRAAAAKRLRALACRVSSQGQLALAAAAVAPSVPLFVASASAAVAAASARLVALRGACNHSSAASVASGTYGKQCALLAWRMLEEASLYSERTCCQPLSASVSQLRGGRTATASGVVR